MRLLQPPGRALLYALVTWLVPAAALAVPPGSSQEPSLAIFFGQIVALIVCGRLVGELMQRIGQPAVMAS